MRDISGKYDTLRTARASSRLHLHTTTIEAIRTGNVPKADPIAVARIAAIQAAKNTSLLIPYCHQVPLDHVAVDITFDGDSIVVTTEVKAIWKTGVEMEALVAASAAVLTLYDMLKPIDESMKIGETLLLEKRGGKSNMHENGEGLTAAVLVLSDSVSKGEKSDTSGRLIIAGLESYALRSPSYKVLSDDLASIEKELKLLADVQGIDLIITTGGTGMGPRDNAPEATLAVIEKRLEGVEEMLRSYGQRRMPMAMLSRCVAGVRGTTLIINLPGSRSGVEDGLNALFPAIFHLFGIMRGAGH